MSRPVLRDPQAQNTQYPTYGSARSSYPTFLPLQDSLLLQAQWAWRGLVDASRWDVVVQLVASDAEIRANALKSLLLNLISLSSIYIFDLLLHPLAKDQPQKWLHRNVGWFYQVLWIFPIVCASLYLNTSWCTLIANRTYTLQHGRSSYASPADSGPAPNAYIAFLNSLATSAYRGVMIVTSVVLGFSLGYVPFVGGLAEFTFLCWVDAYYCFEFIWIARGLSLSRRVRHLEERWAYYFAFGLPSAALCIWGSILANAALFALLFPSYIIMAMHARPGPYDPYNPIPTPSSASASHSQNQRQATIHPSPYVPIRLPIFQPVIFINDWVVKILSLGMRGGRGPGGGVGSGSGGLARGRWNDKADSLEDGEGEEIEMRTSMRAASGGMNGMSGAGANIGQGRVGFAGPAVRTRERIQRGGRRKAD